MLWLCRLLTTLYQILVSGQIDGHDSSSSVFITQPEYVQWELCIKITRRWMQPYINRFLKTLCACLMLPLVCVRSLVHARANKFNWTALVQMAYFSWAKNLKSALPWIQFHILIYFLCIWSTDSHLLRENGPDNDHANTSYLLLELQQNTYSKPCGALVIEVKIS